MQNFRAIIRLICLGLTYLVFLLIGILLNLLFLGSEKLRYRLLSQAAIYLARCFCCILNIKITIVGNMPQTESVLIVANHVGSPDIFVLGACFQASFVSKLELRDWPVLGVLTRLGATLYVDRSRRHDVKNTIDEICKRLESGISVILFPEGGVTDGAKINPFKTSHFESAILAKRPVLPVLIQYHDKNTPSIACWWNMSFFNHMYRLLINPRLDVTVTIFPPVTGQDRRCIAEESFRVMHEKYDNRQS